MKQHKEDCLINCQNRADCEDRHICTCPPSDTAEKGGGGGFEVRFGKIPDNLEVSGNDGRTHPGEWEFVEAQDVLDFKKWCEEDDINVADFIDIWQMRMIVEYQRNLLASHRSQILERIESYRAKHPPHLEEAGGYCLLCALLDDLLTEKK